MSDDTLAHRLRVGDEVLPLSGPPDHRRDKINKGLSEFTITGRTYSHDGVARLLSRLQVVPDLTNVQLVSSTLSKVGNQDVVDFTIAADIKSATGTGS